MQTTPATQAPVLKRATFTVELTPEQAQTWGFWLQQIKDSVVELPICAISFDYEKTIEFEASHEEGMSPQEAATEFTNRIFLAVNDEVSRAAIEVARQTGTDIDAWERDHSQEAAAGDGYAYINTRTGQTAFAKVDCGEIVGIDINDAPAESPAPEGKIMTTADTSEEYDFVSDKAILDSVVSCLEVIDSFGGKADFVAGAEAQREENLTSLQKAVSIMEEMPTLGGLYGLSVLEWAKDVLVRNVPGYDPIVPSDDTPSTLTMH